MASPNGRVLLRPMTARDVRRVWQIDTLAFGAGGWPPSAFRDELERNRTARYFVVERGAEGVVAYVGCWVLPDEVHIVTIAVDPEQQGGGLGELLVIHALDLAAESGAASVQLECRESNAPALALYRKYGFRELGRRRRYYADNGEDALILAAEEVASPAYRAKVERLRTRHRRRHPETAPPPA